MKKTIFCLALILFVSLDAKTQGYPCLNGVSTDYNNPSANANALPTNPTPTGQTNFGSRFLNQFNWFPISNDGQYNGYDTYGLINTNPTPQPDPALIEFIVFPNPTTGASQAGLVLPELSTVSISIVDITGKVQGRPVRNQVLPIGRNVVNLESEPLAPGVYFVQLVVNGEKLTQRLVKQ